MNAILLGTFIHLRNFLTTTRRFAAPAESTRSVALCPLCPLCSNFADGDRSHVEEQIEPSRPDRGIVDSQHDLVASRRLGPPRVGPEAPGVGRRRQRAVFHARPRAARL